MYVRPNLGISWMDKVPNTEVLPGTGLTTMFILLRQSRLDRLRRMENGKFPKTSSTGNIQIVKETLVALSCATRIFVSSTATTRGTLLLIVLGGYAPCLNN